MSYGAVKLEDGTYQSLDGRIVQPADFEKQEYVESRALLTVVAGFPEQQIQALNRRIGQFLRTIQDSSCINRRILNLLQPSEEFLYGENNSDMSTSPTRVSTLPAAILVATIRQNIGELVRDILALAQTSTQEDNSAQPQNAGATPHNGTINFSEHYTHDETIPTDILTGETRDLIYQHGGEKCVKTINDMLHGFAVSVFSRASLSFGSWARDMKTLAQQDPMQDPQDFSEDAPYSTLNPVDLIPMARKQLEYAPAGIILSLPNDKKEKMFARLQRPELAPEKQPFHAEEEPEEQLTAQKTSPEKCPEGYFPWVVHTPYGAKRSVPEGKEIWTHYIEIRDPSQRDEQTHRLPKGPEISFDFLRNKGITEPEKITFDTPVFVKYDQARYLASGGMVNGVQQPPMLAESFIEDIKLG